MKELKKLLRFQSLLPIVLAIVYWPTFIYTQNTVTAEYLVRFTVLTVALAVFIALFIKRTASVRIVAAFVGLSAMFAVILATSPDKVILFGFDVTVITVIIAAMFILMLAWLTASFVKHDLGARNSFELLLVHNLLWAGAIGVATFLAPMLWVFSLVLTLVAIALPIFILSEENRLELKIKHQKTPVTDDLTSPPH
ncbi:MAG: hypothetical protein Q8R36_05045 [bacterium]|nr:hypothetical protein [bacterium]